MPERRKLLSAPERAAGILAAAARVFAAGGYTRTSIEDIAAEAGITKLIVYRHFGSKSALYRAVLAQIDRRLAEIELIPIDMSGHEAALASAGRRLAETMRVARELPDAFTLLIRDAPHEPEFAEYAGQVLARGVPDAETVLHRIADPLVRRWTAEVIRAAVDRALLGWLTLAPAERDAEMAARLAEMLAQIGGVAIRTTAS